MPIETPNTLALLVPEPEARRLLGGLCPKTMYLLRRREGLPFYKIGTRTLYAPSELTSWLASRRKAGTDAK